MSDFDHPALYPALPAVEPRRDAYACLRPAERVFVDAYIAELGASARAAGKRVSELVGVSVPTGTQIARAGRMLALPHVQAAIRDRAEVLSEEFKVSTNALIREISAIAFSNMANYVYIGADGEPIIDLSKCTTEQMGAISEITVEDYKDGRGEDARDVRKVKLKLHDKQNAQEKLMKFLQLYAPERVEINVKSVSINADMTQEQLADMYKQRLAR